MVNSGRLLKTVQEILATMSGALSAAASPLKIHKQMLRFSLEGYFSVLYASQADVAVLLRRLIRDEIKSGKSDKEIYKKLEDDFGETVLYAPKFDIQTAAIWLSPVIVGGVAAGVWAYQKHRQRTNVHIMALNLVRGVPLTPREKETMIDILTPPPPTRRWWWPVK